MKRVYSQDNTVLVESIKQDISLHHRIIHAYSMHERLSLWFLAFSLSYWKLPSEVMNRVLSHLYAEMAAFLHVFHFPPCGTFNKLTLEVSQFAGDRKTLKNTANKRQMT